MKDISLHPLSERGVAQTRANALIDKMLNGQSEKRCRKNSEKHLELSEQKIYLCSRSRNENVSEEIKFFEDIVIMQKETR